MDVRCQQCGNVSQADEGRLAAGPAVLCTRCGAVLRAREALTGAGAEGAPRAPRAGWLLRHRDGTVEPLKDLVTLQEWILARRAGPQDEISKSGETWKRLGSIAELSCLFQALTPDAAPVLVDPAAVAPGSLPPLPPAGRASPGMASTPALGSSPGALDPTRSAVPDVLDDDDPVMDWQRSHRWRTALGLVVSAAVLLGAGAAVVAGPAVWAGLQEGLRGPPPPGAMASLAKARAALLRSGDEDLREAMGEADRALQLRPEWADAEALQSLAHALLAEGLREERRELTAHLQHVPVPPAGTAEPAEVTAARARLAQAEQAEAGHFKDALAWMQKATLRAPAEQLPALAAAAYYVARDVGEDAAEHLARAKLAPPAEGLEVLVALLDAEVRALRSTTRAAALADLERLAVSHPEAVLPRYRLAALHLADGNPTAAAEHAAAALKQHPNHRRCKAILDAARPPAPPDAGSPPDAARPVPREDPEPEPETATEPESNDPTPRKAGGTKKFDKLLAQAEKSRDRGQTGRAVSTYLKAAAAAPERPEPYLGLGWCYLDQEKMDQARASFERALTLDAGNAEAHMGLGQYFEFKGGAFDAIKHYQRYLVLLPNGPESEVARNAISRLKGK